MDKRESRLQDLWVHPLWQDRSQQWTQRWESVPHRERWVSGLLLVAFGALLWLHWPVVIALVAGIAATLLGLFWQDSNGRAVRSFAAELWYGDTSGVLRAVGVGVIAVVSSYALSAAWSSSGDRWLALGVWVQAIATLSVLAVLAWEVGRRQRERSQRIFDSLLRDMGSPTALRRLAAARNWQLHFPVAPTNSHQVRLGVDYLRMVLERETVSEVREALLDNLEAWGFNPNLSDATPEEVNGEETANEDAAVAHNDAEMPAPA